MPDIVQNDPLDPKDLDIQKDKYGVEVTSMPQDGMKAFIFNAKFDNDFLEDFQDEF